MHVFLASASFRREYGGPAYSVSRLAFSLAESGAIVSLWAPDGSALGVRSLFSAVDPFGAPVNELSGPLEVVMSGARQPDLIHDSGLWLPHNHALARIARQRAVPRVVSTRGMLEPWALRHKRVRKSLAWPIYQRRDLITADAIHVTSNAEAESIQARKLPKPIWCIPNGIDLPTKSDVAFQKEQILPRKAIFLGRLHPVKGLTVLLEAWALLRPESWELVLAGPDEAGHRAVLEDLIDRHALGEMVRLLGPVAGPAKSSLFRDADLFVLPSLSESFGMVVAEALAHGVPVLASRNVPWPQLEEAGCGWRVATEPRALSSALAQISTLPRAELAEAGRRGRALVASEFGWSRIADAFLSRYVELRSSIV